MESFDPITLGALVLGGGLGTVLVLLAERYSLLEQRQERRCPSCGRIRRRGACACTG